VRSSHNKKAFTVVELLVVIGIMSLLMSILVPAMMRARAQAKTAMCASNLHQLFLGFTMYLDDNNGYVFPLAYYGFNSEGQVGTYWYFGFETIASSVSLPEGKRILDRKAAKLYPYIHQYDSVEICPAFPYDHPKYKPKYKTKWMTYGINCNLSPDFRKATNKTIVRPAQAVKDSASTLLFTDTAMINKFQAPASTTNPMFEEWHYYDPTAIKNPSAHFRHGNLQANILFCDGHIDEAKPADPDAKCDIPNIHIGMFEQEVKY
jgi:prepilin-type processing-associated H-X9-DG protein/prepilin-type N-terminal cleavage/methylation domain-containing protein